MELGQPAQYAKGRYGVDLVPGSEVVMDRSSGRLVNCTAQICAFGRNSSIEEVTLAVS